MFLPAFRSHVLLWTQTEGKTREAWDRGYTSTFVASDLRCLAVFHVEGIELYAIKLDIYLCPLVPLEPEIHETLMLCVTVQLIHIYSVNASLWSASLWKPFSFPCLTHRLQTSHQCLLIFLLPLSMSLLPNHCRLSVGDSVVVCGSVYSPHPLCLHSTAHSPYMVARNHCAYSLHASVKFASNYSVSPATSKL